MVQKSETNVEALKKSGIVKLNEKDMYAIWIKTLCCNLNSKQLRKIADITDKYARSFLLFTTRQIPIIPFVNIKDVEKVRNELSEVYLEFDHCGPRVRNINVCYDDKICPDAIVNSLSLGEKLDNYFHDPINHKIKIGVAGCQKDCIISRVLNDIGFVGMSKNGIQGYKAYVGGKLGLNPSIGVEMAEFLTESECINFVQNYFDYLNIEGKTGERSADLIKRLGVERVKNELNKYLHKEAVYKNIECQTRLKEKETDKIILKIRATCGEITTKQLRKIADISEEYGKDFIHFAVRGDPEIPCVDIRDLGDIRNDLADVDLEILERGIDNIQACFGGYCTESNIDTQPFLRKIEKMIEDLNLNNLNLRISASGCPNSCGISQLNDIGFLGIIEPEIDATYCNGCKICVAVCKRKAIEIRENRAIIDKDACRNCGHCITVCPSSALIEKRRGFAILVGGQEGEDTRLAEVIAEFLSEEETIRITEKCLRILKEKNVNAAKVIEDFGIEKFKEMLGIVNA